MRDRQAQMALARQRLLTMAFGDMETIRMVGLSYQVRGAPLTNCSIAPQQLHCKLSQELHFPLFLTPFAGTRSCGQRVDQASSRCTI